MRLYLPEIAAELATERLGQLRVVKFVVLRRNRLNRLPVVRAEDPCNSVVVCAPSFHCLMQNFTEVVDTYATTRST